MAQWLVQGPRLRSGKNSLELTELTDCLADSCTNKSVAFMKRNSFGNHTANLK